MKKLLMLTLKDYMSNPVAGKPFFVYNKQGTLACSGTTSTGGIIQCSVVSDDVYKVRVGKCMIDEELKPESKTFNIDPEAADNCVVSASALELVITAEYDTLSANEKKTILYQLTNRGSFDVSYITPRLNITPAINYTVDYGKTTLKPGESEDTVIHLTTPGSGELNLDFMLEGTVKTTKIYSNVLSTKIKIGKQDTIGGVAVTPAEKLEIIASSVRPKAISVGQTFELGFSVQNKGTGTLNNLEFTPADGFEVIKGPSQSRLAQLLPGDVGDYSYTLKAKAPASRFSYTVRLKDDAFKEHVVSRAEALRVVEKKTGIVLSSETTSLEIKPNQKKTFTVTATAKGEEYQDVEFRVDDSECCAFSIEPNILPVLEPDKPESIEVTISTLDVPEKEVSLTLTAFQKDDVLETLAIPLTIAKGETKPKDTYTSDEAGVQAIIENTIKEIATLAAAGKDTEDIESLLEESRSLMQQAGEKSKAGDASAAAKFMKDAKEKARLASTMALELKYAETGKLKQDNTMLMVAGVVLATIVLLVAIYLRR